MINNNILRAVLDSMSKEQKEQLIAELIAEVGNLQPDDLKIPERKIEGERVIVDTPLVDKIQPLKKMSFDTDWGKNIDGKRPVRAQANTWTDNGECRDEEFDPTGLKVTPRSRPDANNKIVEQTCSVCNKTFKIDSSLVYGQFIRCDRCT